MIEKKISGVVFWIISQIYVVAYIIWAWFIVNENIVAILHFLCFLNIL